MATHSCILAQRIPWTEEPAVHRVAQSQTRLKRLSMHACMHQRRKWQPTPVFLPGESQGQRSLVGCRLWDHTESDTTEVTQQQQQQIDIRYNCCPKMTLLGTKSRYFQIQKLFLNLSPIASVENYLPSSNYSFELFFSGMKFQLYFFQVSFKAHFTYLIWDFFFFCYFLHLNNFSFT